MANPWMDAYWRAELPRTIVEISGLEHLAGSSPLELLYKVGKQYDKDPLNEEEQLDNKKYVESGFLAFSIEAGLDFYVLDKMRAWTPGRLQTKGKIPLLVHALTSKFGVFNHKIVTRLLELDGDLARPCEQGGWSIWFDYLDRLEDIDSADQDAESIAQAVEVARVLVNSEAVKNCYKETDRFQRKSSGFKKPDAEKAFKAAFDEITARDLTLMLERNISSKKKFLGRLSMPFRK